MTGEGYIPSIYKRYGKVISLMGKWKYVAHVKPIEPCLKGVREIVLTVRSLKKDETVPTYLKDRSVYRLSVMNVTE